MSLLPTVPLRPLPVADAPPRLAAADPTSPVAAALLGAAGHPWPEGLTDCDDENRRVLYDFCLMPYPCGDSPYRNCDTVNVLLWSFAAMGVAREGRQLVDNLRRVLGPQCTVWGVKCRPETDEYWWEFYFYRRDHVPHNLDLALVRPAFAPVAIDAVPPPDIAWTFFSIELTVAQLRGEKPAHLRLYQEGLDLSWAVRGQDLELENHYQHFDVDGQVLDLVSALRTSVHAPAHPLTLARLVPPQLARCWRIWLARKRRADTIYFQRVAVLQVLWLARHYGWPAAFCAWLEAAAPYLQHAQFDLGVDFRRAALLLAGEPLPAGEPPLTFGKTGIYSAF